MKIFNKYAICALCIMQLGALTKLDASAKGRPQAQGMVSFAQPLKIAVPGGPGQQAPTVQEIRALVEQLAQVPSVAKNVTGFTDEQVKGAQATVASIEKIIQTPTAANRKSLADLRTTQMNIVNKLIKDYADAVESNLKSTQAGTPVTAEAQAASKALNEQLTTEKATLSLLDSAIGLVDLILNPPAKPPLPPPNKNRSNAIR